MSIKVLLIGAGSIGQRHARLIRALRPGAQFWLLRGRPVSDAFSDEIEARLVQDFSALDLAGFDLAVVASPTADHITVLPDLIASGVAMLVEKPVVSSLADCGRLSALLASAPPAVRVAAFNMRHLPSLIRARALVAEGRLGRICRAGFTAGLWLPDWRPGRDWRQGYAVEPSRGGGVALDLAHEPDLARWLLGDLQVVAAASGSFSSLAIAAEDTALFLLRGAGGAGPLVQISLDYVSRQRVRHFELTGDEATLLWSLEGSLQLLGPGGRETIDCGPSGFDLAESYEAMMRRLFAAMAGDWQAPLQSLTDGIASTALALAASKGGEA